MILSERLVKEVRTPKVLFRYFTDMFVFFRMFQVVVCLVRRNEKICYGNCVVYCKSLKRWIFGGGGGG